MAKRRKVAPPTEDIIEQMEARFRGETPSQTAKGIAPIAQIAADSVRDAFPFTADLKATQVINHREAKELHKLRAEGREILLLPLDQIDEDAMIRDRTQLDPSEMDELIHSIEAHGLRLPIEVFRRETSDTNSRPFGLLSGYRRLRAVREIASRAGQAAPAIHAIERDPDALGGAFAAMVEENEIRANLSHFERGRIAVVAAQQGVFTGTEEGVNSLFAAASKAKRSKIRAFALIFEELGDMLIFPERLKERDGLRLAAALRAGAEADLRESLAHQTFQNADEEWQALDAIITGREARTTKDPARGGRPKSSASTSGWRGDTRVLSSGVTLQHVSDTQGHMIRIQGGSVDAELIESAIEHLAYLFEKPST